MQDASPQQNGKLGLALSGGGFRASFFHIGVLGRMAELGLLRQVEVISTVSGGSVIGALYYLRLRNLLRQKTDPEIDDNDYVELVNNLAKEFFEATKKDLRTRTFANPFINLKMYRPDYSRSDRIGELYERFIYCSAFDPAKLSKTRIEMRDLSIHPRVGGIDEEPEFDRSFDPDPKKVGVDGRTDNDARNAKVPVILINATTLNTGHDWRFQVDRMGEPKRQDEAAYAVDKNVVLSTPDSYGDLVEKHQNMELGNAVAASAAVPGIFHPFALSGLYPNDYRVQLVDGGVHDNQGIQALRERDCRRYVVSDASGQLEDEEEPSTNVLGVIGRTSSILMDRVREEEIGALLEKRKSNEAKVAFVHLLKEIPATNFNPLPASPARPPKQTLSYGVDPDVQVNLARIRTDLDAFTETEAYSLMADGYLMSGPEFAKELGIQVPELDDRRSIPEHWLFANAAAHMAEPEPHYAKQLEVGRETLFKLFRLIRVLWIVPAVLAAIILVLVYVNHRDALIETSLPSVSVHDVLVALVVGIVAALLSLMPRLAKTFKILRFLHRVYQSPTAIWTRYVVRAIPAFVVAGIAWFHIAFVVPAFLFQGRLKDRAER